jgi:hypothetical protein
MLPFVTTVVERPRWVEGPTIVDHIDEAGGLAAELDAAVRQRFVTDTHLQPRIVPRGRKA